MMRSKNFLFSTLAVSPMVMLMACGGGGSSDPATASTTELTSAIAEVPVVGSLIADCTDTGLAIIQGFVPAGALPVPADVPSADAVFAIGDPNMIPVIGGFLPAPSDPTELVSGTIDEVLSMIPADGLPADLSVIGSAPISCSDNPLPTGDLPDPTEALGAIPVFDANGDPVGLVLATIGSLPAGDAPIPTDVTLPVGTDALPEPLGSAVGTVLSLLDMLPV